MASKKQKVAFVTGVTGQDGAHLAAHLLRDGWRVCGGFRRGSSNKTWRMEALGIASKVELIECQLSEPQHIIEIFQTIHPDHVYNLAGDSFVADSFKYPGVSLEVNTHGALNILDAARLVIPETRLFFASSSEIFGGGDFIDICNESTPCYPSNPYGVSKLATQNFVRLYRECYGLFACSGILFNHEGPLRGRAFVTRKITFNIARLRVQGGLPIEMGNMNAARDWGAADDYVEAMRAMLEQEEAKDMIIASGSLATVRDFLRMAACSAGFDPVFEGEGIDEVCVDRKSGMHLAKVSERYFRPYDTPPRVGDPSMIESETGWRRKVGLEQMISEMVHTDINRWEKGMTSV
jgi:GDPmannose 4,6-dehydratase